MSCVASSAHRAGTKRASPGPGITEEAIHRAVVAHLERRSRPGVVWWHVPNGEARGPGLGGKLRALGTRAGMPDLMLLAAGRLHCLELKREGGRVSPAQRAMLGDLEAGGAAVAIAFGLDDALAQLSRWALMR